MTLWPEGLAGRLAVILVAGLLLVQGASLLVYWQERDLGAFRTFAASVAERVTNAVAVIEQAEPETGQRLLRMISNPFLRVHLTAQPPLPVAEDSRFAALIRPLILEELRPLNRPGIEVQVPERRHGPHGRYRITIAVPLASGDWLTVNAASPFGPPPWLPRLGWLLFFITLIVVLAAWSARRLARPLTLFAAAADRLGVDVNAPPLPEHGSRELRQATHAFNRMQERIQRLIDDRTRLLAAISHDLRTSLTRLRLRVDYIDDPEQQRKALADIEAMRTMLEATLSFARDDAATEARTTLDLAVLLQSLCEDAADNGQNVSYSGPERLALTGRPVALQRALANLIDNAVTYGGEALVTLTAAGETVVIRVEDRGPGIPAAQREQVFAPFARLETSRSRETGGTGLGLTVARSIVHRHGGHITLADRTGGGLTVQVTLPRAPVTESERRHRGQPGKPTATESTP